MGRIAFSIAALGDGAYDGEKAVVRFGGERARMRWDLGGEKWIGDEQRLITFCELDAMIDANGVPDVYDYFKTPISGAIGGWGWEPHPILNANLAYNAGLNLYVKFDAVYWSFDPAKTYTLGLILYPFSSAALINPLIDPADFVGLELDSLPGQRRFSTTGWVVNPLGSPGQSVIAPHLYTKFVDGPDNGSHSRLEYLRCSYRWES